MAELLTKEIIAASYRIGIHTDAVILKNKGTKRMEKDLFTSVNRNGRQYNVDVLNNAISEWARNNGVFIEGEKDVNYFCQREKNASKYDKHEEYGKLTRCVIDPQCVFIDYTNLLGR